MKLAALTLENPVGKASRKPHLLECLVLEASLS